MFTDNERTELVAKMKEVLEKNGAGRAAEREALASLLTDTAREFLSKRYKSGDNKKKKTGIVTLKDTLRDIKRKM